MALSAPRALFGVHSFSPYNRSDGLFFGTLKVLKGSSLSLSAEMVELTGGSSKYPWGVEEGMIQAELSLKFGQFEDFLFTLFLGKAPTANAAEALGNVSTLTNKKGTTCKSATVGIASVTVKAGSESDLKFGKYVVKAVSATTADIYFSSDLDIGRGNNAAMQSDVLKVSTTALTIAAGAPVDVPNFGIQLTGGTGPIAMVPGDTATFEVRPANSASMSVDIGGTADQAFPEFGAIVMAAKRGTGEMFEVDCFRCKGAGMPLNFEQNQWHEAEVKIKCLYDSDLDKVFSIRYIKTI